MSIKSKLQGIFSGGAKEPAAEAAPPKHFYSASARGFFAEHVHGERRPKDCVEITLDEWQALLEAQSSGKEIVPGDGGRPIAAERVVTPEQCRVALLADRDAALAATDGAVTRHRDETEMGTAPKTLTSEQYAQLLWYRKALRDLPQHPGFPDCALPESPLL